MINLLPTDKKAQIRAARTNVVLVRYIFIILFALAFILGTMYVAYRVLTLTKTSSEQTIASNDLKAGAYNETKTQVDTLNASLGEAKTLLDQEIRFSKVLTNIAKLAPQGTVLDRLTLDAESFGINPVTTKVYGKTAADISQLKSNFEQSPLLTGVTIQPIVEAGEGTEAYPVSSTITFTLNRAAAL